MPNKTVTNVDGYVTIEFERGTEPYFFRDAIVVTPEEYAQLTPEQIDAMEQKRYDDWLAIINPIEPPPEPPEPIEPLVEE